MDAFEVTAATLSCNGHGCPVGILIKFPFHTYLPNIIQIGKNFTVICGALQLIPGTKSVPHCFILTGDKPVAFYLG